MTTWGARKTIGAIAVAAAVAGVGGAAIAAATDTGSGPGGFGDFGGFGGFGGGGPEGPPGAMRHTDIDPAALHGEYVVADGRGGFATMVTQTGRITAVSTTAVTARSDDGYTQTYVIRSVPGAGSPHFTVGEVTTIRATREGEAVMVSTIGPPPSPGR